MKNLVQICLHDVSSKNLSSVQHDGEVAATGDIQFWVSHVPEHSSRYAFLYSMVVSPIQWPCALCCFNMGYFCRFGNVYFAIILAKFFCTFCRADVQWFEPISCISLDFGQLWIQRTRPYPSQQLQGSVEGIREFFLGIQVATWFRCSTMFFCSR